MDRVHLEFSRVRFSVECTLDDEPRETLTELVRIEVGRRVASGTQSGLESVNDAGEIVRREALARFVRQMVRHGAKMPH